MTCTSLPTNTPAFASTVDRRDPTIVWESMKMPRQSAAAPTSSTVSFGRPVRRWKARYVTGDLLEAREPVLRSTSTRIRAPSVAKPATKSTGNTRSNALGRRMSNRVSSIRAPPALSRDKTSSDPAIGRISHGTHESRRFEEWASKVRMKETPDTTPSTTRPAAPAATAHVIETVRADGATGPGGPNVAISHDAAPSPAAAPKPIGMTASTVALTANRPGPQPWAWRNAASVRRPATANAAAAATTAAATPRPAIRSSRSGPAAVAVLRSTSWRTSGIDERNSVSRRRAKKPSPATYP